MEHWAKLYYSMESCEALTERYLIASMPLRTPVGPSPAARLTLGYILKTEIQSVYGSSNLVWVLSALEQLDGIISKAANLPEAPVRVHHGLYGITEYAHAPLKKPEYISFNLLQGRVRDLLRGILVRDKIAMSALTDLMLHEKAHLSILHGGAASGSHDQLFYQEKAKLKRLLVEVFRNNPSLDPFRLSRFIGATLTEPEDLASKFPISVRTGPLIT